MLHSCWEKKTCSSGSRTTFRRCSRAPAGSTCSSAACSSSSSSSSSSSKLQKQLAAASTNKQKCGLSCAFLGTRWNQRPHFFVVLFVRDQAEQQMKLKNLAKLFLFQTDLASCRLRISITTRPAAQSQLHSNDQGKVKP